MLGAESESFAAFSQRVGNQMTSIQTAVVDATTNPEPPGVDRDEANNFQGYVRFAPYGGGCHP